MIQVVTERHRYPKRSIKVLTMLQPLQIYFPHLQSFRDALTIRSPPFLHTRNLMKQLKPTDKPQRFVPKLCLELFFKKNV